MGPVASRYYFRFAASWIRATRSRSTAATPGTARSAASRSASMEPVMIADVAYDRARSEPKSVAGRCHLFYSP